MDLVELLKAIKPLLKLMLELPVPFLLLGLFGIFFYKRWIGKLSIISSLALLYASSIPATVQWLGKKFETIPPLTNDQISEFKPQAILLLTGGNTGSNPELNAAARVNAATMQRASYAARLHRETGLPVIVTGGVVYQGQTHEARSAARWLKDVVGIQPIAIEDRATNTLENLQFSKPIIEHLGYQRVVVVTHAYHMPRALQSAEIAGVNAIGAPFGYLARYPFPQDNLPTWKAFVPESVHISSTDALLHEWIGQWWYRKQSRDN